MTVATPSSRACSPSFRRSGPVYEPAAPDEDNCAWITLSQGKTWTTAVTTIRYGGKTARGMSRETIAPGLDPYEAERLRQKAVKLSFFKAAREITGVTPSWGALTGLRPGKPRRAHARGGQVARARSIRVLRDTYYVSPERRRLAIEAAQAGLRAKRALAPDEISLYIGIPFCPTRCAYCSFVSQAVEKTFRLMDPYLDVLCREITDAARMVRETGAAREVVLHGRRHADDALSPADGPSADAPEPQL